MSLGYDVQEIEMIMGGPLPEDHAQALAYARIALSRLEEHDKERFSHAWLLNCAPDEILALWREISRTNTVRQNSKGKRS